ncbi:cAMP-responsive element modulator-like isoform X1 [Carassius auratus]|uniref:cAMP-responsive element modulator-like isoform X1 n=1 Tax=Carassius auratus TaxID=7957 RepID=A0A6P6RNT1_CARAU|nr:cAMP-responsive element modulator-like isoform X1 [Carassius auratus]XP_026136609.1 cAMP-responsive element modulator-like isoform X1 [Carassius auratus]XP_026146679.1 cAMP-responsive element modulator-like isoform X1 [Carassius auratus]XP_026146688.1 cAMP-responsive element modulator-like isoform X1 [Carassius auratus]
METATIAQQETNATEKVTSEVNEGVSVGSLPDGQTLQVQEVIQSTQPSVIQSPQIKTVQVVVDTGGTGSNPSDPQKRREILSRRPSYRKILNELSSDVRAVPKIEEEEKVEEETLATSSVATVMSSSSIYQTSSGQYIAITQGGAIQLAGPGGEALQGVQALTLPSPTTPQSGATILQYGSQPGDPGQQLLLTSGQVLVQAATGDMPAYQIRSPSSGLPPGVVMAASPGTMHIPQQNAEEATRKREVRLMKNREAARECRKKKKEYVKCLENRVAVLENQNKTLIEELKALKDIYCHKSE